MSRELDCGGVPSTDGRPGSGLAALPDEVLGAVASALWWESEAFRNTLHGRARTRHCDTSLVAGAIRLGNASTPDTVAGGFAVGGACICRDYLVDVLVEADRFLAAGPRHNPPGAVRTHLRKRVTGDWIRRQRVERGAQARTDRIRGSEIGLRLPDEYHRAILEHLVDEAGSLAPLDGEEQLVGRLTQLVVQEFGGAPVEHRPRVLAALTVVERAGRSGRRTTDGGEPTTWWERYVERPLGRRQRHSDLAIGTGGDRDERMIDVECPRSARAFDDVVAAVATPPRGPAPLRARLQEGALERRIPCRATPRSRR